MSLFARRGLGDTNSELIPSRNISRVGGVYVTADSALYASTVWAALRLRANLISTMPLDVYRNLGNLSVEVAKPPVFVNPGGSRINMQRFLYSSQIDLDRVGNSIGVISERDGSGLPKRIDLADMNYVKVQCVNDVLTYWVHGKAYAESDIWHEVQYPVSGQVMGLSAIEYASWSIGQYQSALQFGLEWFANGAQVPAGHLKNTSKTILPDQADIFKRRFKESIQNRDVFVSGSDWEWTTQTVNQNESQFLETQHASAADIARYFDVPTDLIDVASQNKSAVTYASITQRNLQFLIMSLGPVFARREVSLSQWLPQPRYVKFNTDALLRMDPAARNTMLLSQVNVTRTPTEVRAVDDLPPFTPAQLEEIKSSAPEPVEPVVSPTAVPSEGAAA